MGSKLVVLWLIDVVFGGSVSLGGFIPVTLLALALLLSRSAVRRLLYSDTALPLVTRLRASLPRTSWASR